MNRKNIYLLAMIFMFFSCGSRKVNTTILRPDCDQTDINNENLYFLKNPTEIVKNDRIINYYNDVNLKVEKITSTNHRKYELNDEFIYFSSNQNCDIILRRYDRFLIFLKSNYVGEFRPSSIVDFQISEMFIFNIDSNLNYRLSFSKPIQLMLSKCEYNWNYSDLSSEKFEEFLIKTYAIENIDFDKKTISLLKANNEIDTLNLTKIEELPIYCGITI